MSGESYGVGGLGVVSYKVSFETFGCRLNQAETAVFVRQFADRGYRWVPESDDADLCIIHTCSLTAHATSKCRRLIRSIVHRNPDACIAAVGCYAQTGVEELKEIKGLDYIIGTSDKMRLTEIIESPVKVPEPVVVIGKAERDTFKIDGAGYYPAHTRANLKVQEGCNFVCSFCIIPRSRGPARSRDFADILREARVLVEEGHRELIITGINVGTYEDDGKTLAGVIGALETIDGLERIRLSSIEPTTIEDRLIARMASGTKLCPYLHIPLQSGDDGVLLRMRRKYTSREYSEFIEKVMMAVPSAGLGTDVIVGFPGEDDRAFDKTYRFIEKLPFNNVHVFSFSARQGTGAYHMSGQVPGHVIAERSKAMHRLADRKKREYYERQIGDTLRVLFEERGSDGRYVGFTDSYIKVGVRTDRDLSNRLGWVKISGSLVSESGRLLAIGETTEPENDEASGRWCPEVTSAARSDL